MSSILLHSMNLIFAEPPRPWFSESRRKSADSEGFSLREQIHRVMGWAVHGHRAHTAHEDEKTQSRKIPSLGSVHGSMGTLADGSEEATPTKNCFRDGSR